MWQGVILMRALSQLCGSARLLALFGIIKRERIALVHHPPMRSNLGIPPRHSRIDHREKGRVVEFDAIFTAHQIYIT